MSTPYLVLPHIASNQNSKEVTANNDFDELDESINGKQTINCAGSGNITITNPTVPGVPLYAFLLNLIGALTGDIDLILPAQPKVYAIANNTIGTNPSLSLPWTVYVITSAGGSVGIYVPQGYVQMVYSDGTNVYPLALY